MTMSSRTSTPAPAPTSSTPTTATDITIQFPYQVSADVETVMLGQPTEVELTTSVAVAAKALQRELQTKAGRVLKGSNADHITQAISHLHAVAQSAGIMPSADDDKNTSKNDDTDDDKKVDEPDETKDATYKVQDAEGDLPFAVVNSDTGKVKAKHPTRARAKAHARELNSEGKAGTCQCPDAEQADAVNGICAYCGKPVPAKSDEPDETKVLLSDAEVLMFEHLRETSAPFS